MYSWHFVANPYRALPLVALVVFLVFFSGVFVWAYWPRRRFDDAARLPLAEDGHEL